MPNKNYVTKKTTAFRYALCSDPLNKNLVTFKVILKNVWRRLEPLEFLKLYLQRIGLPENLVTKI